MMRRRSPRASRSARSAVPRVRMGAPPDCRDARQQGREPLAGALVIDRDGLAHHPGRLGVTVPVLEAALVVVKGGAGDAYGAAAGKLGRAFGGVASSGLRPRFKGRRRNGGTRRRVGVRSHAPSYHPAGRPAADGDGDGRYRRGGRARLHHHRERHGHGDGHGDGGPGRRLCRRERRAVDGPAFSTKMSTSWVVSENPWRIAAISR